MIEGWDKIELEFKMTRIALNRVISSFKRMSQSCDELKMEYKKWAEKASYQK